MFSSCSSLATCLLPGPIFVEAFGTTLEQRWARAALSITNGSGGPRGLTGSAAVRGLVNLGFHLGARLRVSELAEIDPVRTQASVLRRLVRKASRTVFGRDHGFDRIELRGRFPGGRADPNL